MKSHYSSEYDEKEYPKSIVKEIDRQIKNNILATTGVSTVSMINLHYILKQTPLDKIIKSFTDNQYTINFYLCRIKDIKGIKYKEILEKSNLKESILKKYFVIKKGSCQRIPSRDAVIDLSIVFELGIEDVNYLLKIAGYNELHVKNKRDIIIAKCITEQKSVRETNKSLFLNGEEQIGNYFLYNNENIDI